MNTNLLKLLVIMLAVASVNSFSRSPAVENFFELDVETGFEFKKVQKAVKIVKAKQVTDGFAITTLIGLFALFALPFSTHLVISVLNKRRTNSDQQGTVEIISKYKKVVKESNDDDIKKAS
jgi:di/tricarboxylate transporter